MDDENGSDSKRFIECFQLDKTVATAKIVANG